jgi:hypothetical protein
MALTILDTGTVYSRWLAAVAVLGRAAGGLVSCALRHPGRPMAISRTTGRVTFR